MVNKKLIYIVSSIAILVAFLLGGYVYLVNARSKTYVYNERSFQYNSSVYSIESTKPEEKTYPRGASPITEGSLFLKAQDYSIEFYLRSSRIPDSDAFTWSGYTYDDLSQYFDYVIEDTDLMLPAFISAHVLVCNESQIDEALFCNFRARSNSDDKYYMLEEDILGFKNTQIAISFNSSKAFTEKLSFYPEMKDTVQNILNATSL
jgi:hypothetical protein